MNGIEMYDSVAWQDIPTGARIVAGYIDGDYAWPREAWARFPHAIKVLITVRGDLRANACDPIEGGNMTVAQTRQWIIDKQRDHEVPCTVYGNVSTWNSTLLPGLDGLAYYRWVADWTGQPHTVPSSVACQYAEIGTRYDCSAAYSGAWLRAVDAANRPWPLAA